MLIDTAQLTEVDNNINGNHLIYKNKKCQMKIFFKGTGNEIKIGENVTLSSGFTLTLPNHCKILLGDNTSLSGGEIQFFDNSKLFIGKNVKINNFKRIRLYQGSEIVIGDNTSFGSGLAIDNHSIGKLQIGRDCMFSWNNEILIGDGHPIYDVQTGDVINHSVSYPYSCVIEDHVWVGGECCIMAGAHIKTSTVVGYKSTVDKAFPNNVILAGIPAKIVRENVTWNRYTYLNSEKFFNEMPEKYRRITDLDCNFNYFGTEGIQNG